jgi:pyruvate kinase
MRVRRACGSCGLAQYLRRSPPFRAAAFAPEWRDDPGVRRGRRRTNRWNARCFGRRREVVVDTRSDLQSRELRSVLRDVRELRALLRSAERAEGPVVGDTPAARSRRNLRHYLALRGRDIRPLQERLSRLGLSSLGRCESHVLASVDAVVHILERASGEELSLPSSDGAPTFDEGRAILERRAEQLLGPSPHSRPTRVMVTLDCDAIDDPGFVDRLLSAGTNAVRINCGHDAPGVWVRMAERIREAATRLGVPCAIHVDLAGPKIRTCDLAEPLTLSAGDLVFLSRSAGKRGPSGVPVVGCTIPRALDGVRPGQAVWFDDGKLGGVTDAVSAEGVTVRITHARDGRRRLSVDRGINFPDSPVDVPGFTAKDREDLAVIADFADSVALSFAQRAEDVRALQACLLERGRPHVGIVLKIETRRGFESLPRLLLAHDAENPLGVMIARGDLAIEIGYERLAEVQEEILWLCEAAHVPVIWATQVLETLSKDGMPTRAEVTDAAMAGRAECVMLNKGKHVVETVRMLDDILRRMAEHQHKKSAQLRALHVSRAQ